MKLKLNKDGSAVVRNGMPVYVHANGREEAFDAPAAMKLAVGKHFETSKAAAGLKIPHDLAAAFFGDSFRIEAGKLVAYAGDVPMYSHTRHGEVANFDEALGQLIDLYPNKASILREPGQTGAAAPGQQGPAGPAITRAQFDTMPQDTRAKFIKEGGRIADGASSVSARTPAVGLPQGGIKTMTRAQFDQIPPMERAGFIKAGGRIAD